MAGKKRPGIWVALSAEIPMSGMADVSDGAYRLWTYGLMVARRQQSAGEVSAKTAARLAGQPIESVQELLAAGKWHRAGHDCEDCPQPPEGLVQIHGYEVWQDTGEEIALRSAYARQAVGKRHGLPSVEHEQTGHPTEEEEEEEEEQLSSRVEGARKRATRAPASYPVGADLVDWCEQELGVTNPDWIQYNVNEFLEWARSQDRRYKVWGAAIKKSLRRAAERSGRSQAPAATSAGEAQEDLEEQIREWMHAHPLIPGDDLIRAQESNPPEYHRKMQQLQKERRAEAIVAIRRENLRSV